MQAGQSIPEGGIAWFIRIHKTGGDFVWILAVNTIIIAAIIFSYHYFELGKKIPGIGLGLMLDGASIMIDRLWPGYVTDFINGGILIYNIADIAIFSGIIMTVAYVCWQWWVFVRG